MDIGTEYLLGQNMLCYRKEEFGTTFNLPAQTVFTESSVSPRYNIILSMRDAKCGMDYNKNRILLILIQFLVPTIHQIKTREKKVKFLKCKSEVTEPIFALRHYHIYCQKLLH